MRNKRGYLRILEATISILIVAGVLVTIYSNSNVGAGNDGGDYIVELEKQILGEVTLDNNLRNAVLSDVLSERDILYNFVDSRIPSTYNYSLNICLLDGSPCKLDNSIFILTYGQEIFVEEKIISANYKLFNPKKIVLFVWKIKI